jgi:hypothetical protein
LTYWEGSSTSTNSLLEDTIGGFRALHLITTIDNDPLPNPTPSDDEGDD